MEVCIFHVKAFSQTSMLFFWSFLGGIFFFFFFFFFLRRQYLYVVFCLGGFFFFFFFFFLWEQEDFLRMQLSSAIQNIFVSSFAIFILIMYSCYMVRNFGLKLGFTTFV